MEIQECMKHPVHCVKPLDSIGHAREIMEAHRVNQPPVVVDRCVVGIITDRDLRAAFPSVFDSPRFDRHKAHSLASDPKLITVEMVMTRNVLTLGPHAFARHRRLSEASDGTKETCRSVRRH